MISNDEIVKSENIQSHTFIFFRNKCPYHDLGWERYRKFNAAMNNMLKAFQQQYRITVYLHEYEPKIVEDTFVWCFSFFGKDSDERDSITKLLKLSIDHVMRHFYDIKDSELIAINNHDPEFKEQNCIFELGEYYLHLIRWGDNELTPEYPNKEKSYEKENLDITLFENALTAREFNNIINDYMWGPNPAESMTHRFALDGFHSNQQRPNKYLREELLPTQLYLLKFNVSDSALVKFGIEKENFDVLINDIENNKQTIIEITLACPDKDHLLLSLFNQTLSGFLPAKNLAQLKIAIDSLSEKIIEAINKKHNKNYQDTRTLIVIIQSEYTYQGEEYIVNELIDEVRNNLPLGRGNFEKILLLCRAKFYVIF